MIVKFVLLSHGAILLCWLCFVFGNQQTLFISKPTAATLKHVPPTKRSTTLQSADPWTAFPIGPKSTTTSICCSSIFPAHEDSSLAKSCSLQRPCWLHYTTPAQAFSSLDWVLFHLGSTTSIFADAFLVFPDLAYFMLSSVFLSRFALLSTTLWVLLLWSFGHYTLGFAVWSFQMTFFDEFGGVWCIYWYQAASLTSFRLSVRTWNTKIIILLGVLLGN